MKFLAKVMKKNVTAFQGMAWSLIAHKNTIKNCSTALQAVSFRSLSLCVLYSLFHKGKDTSAVPGASVQHLA